MQQQNPLAMAAGNTLMLTVTLASMKAVQITVMALAAVLIILHMFTDPTVVSGIMLIVMCLIGLGTELVTLSTEDQAQEIAESLMASLTQNLGGTGTVSPLGDMQAPYDTEAAPSGGKPNSGPDWPTDQ